MAQNQPQYDALTVGTGFAGLYTLYLLKQQGLNVRGVEAGADVGGTWHWNRYPGARSDVESYTYRLSFDKELLRTSKWEHNYLKQPEIQADFQDIARKHELYPLIKFNTELSAASWDDKLNRWDVTLSDGEKFSVRYIAAGIGILHNAFIPDIPGLETFKGKTVHSSRWTPDIEYKDKKIAVIGTGASGVQLVGALSETAKELTQFIRHAQYVLPASYRPIPSEERKSINDNYDKTWEQVFNSAVAFGFDEPNRPTFSVSPEEREKIFQDLWDKGSGFRFMFGGFNDIVFSEDANKEAVAFIHKKIKEIVKDPQKAEVLTSSDWFARRPLTDDRYYKSFNQDNVFVVDIKKNPITAVTPEGIKTADSKIHEVDLIVFATGFHAVDGSYHRIDFKGRKGKSLEDHWAGIPKSHTSAATSDFPNLLFINGPGVPFSNQPPAIEVNAEFVADLIARAEEFRKAGKGPGIVESSAQADEHWLDECRKVAELSLFSKTNSWFFGENIASNTKSPRFWFGGLNAYRKAIDDVKSDGYAGFNFGEVAA